MSDSILGFKFFLRGRCSNKGKPNLWRSAVLHTGLQPVGSLDTFNEISQSDPDSRFEATFFRLFAVDD